MKTASEDHEPNIQTWTNQDVTLGKLLPVLSPPLDH